MHYSFQLIKCDDTECKFHQPIRNLDQHRVISWLPAPEEDPQKPGKYKDFENSFRDKDIKPKETCRPTAKGNITETLLKKPPFAYVQQKARACIQCVECKKGRLLYSDKKLTVVAKKKLEKSIDDGLYVCGSELFTEDEELNSIIFQHHGNNCQKAMTAAFYSSGPKCLFYKFICSTCFEANEAAVEDTKKFKGLPRCVHCKDMGFICLKYKK